MLEHLSVACVTPQCWGWDVSGMLQAHLKLGVLVDVLCPLPAQDELGLVGHAHQVVLHGVAQQPVGSMRHSHTSTSLQHSMISAYHTAAHRERDISAVDQHKSKCFRPTSFILTGLKDLRQIWLDLLRDSPLIRKTPFWRFLNRFLSTIRQGNVHWDHPVGEEVNMVAVPAVWGGKKTSKIYESMRYLAQCKCSVSNEQNI